MNNKGQTLVIFVLLIPLFIMFLALVVDLGIITNANIKYTSIARECIKITKEKSLKEAEEYLSSNNLKKEDYKISINNNEIEIRINTKINAIFGTIINMKEYKINILEKGEV